MKININKYQYVDDIQECTFAFDKKDLGGMKQLSDTNTISLLEALLIITKIILFVFFVVRCIRYGRKYDRYLKRMYPDVVEQIRINHPLTLKIHINPLFSISIVEGNAVKDDKLRFFRRKAIFYFVCAFLVFIFFSILSIIIFD